MPTCSHCGGPVTGAGHPGRPWPGRSAATYCCFGCLSLGEQQAQEAAAPRSGWALDGLGVRLGVSLLVLGQSMIFGLALNLHDDVPAGVRWFTQTLILCATLLVAVLLGGPLARAAWGELRRGRLTIEALFLLTAAGAMAASLQAHLTGRGAIYFEVVSVLLVVYTLGKVIGARSRAAALAGSRAWAGQLSTCRLVDAKGHTRVVPVTEVCPGDIVEVYPGETVAVDGVIREGIGFVSEAPVSGEPFAVVRRPGDRALAGVASFDAALRIEATAAGTDRQVDRLLAAVEQARDRPLSFQANADRLARVFLPLVVLTALGTFAYWTRAASWEEGLFNAMAVLLVACPCALGLATPVVTWAALARLAERGLVVRAGDAIERLAAVDRVLLDKTGTLTDDRFALVDIATAAAGEERVKVLGWLSLVEARCNHPIAQPFAALPRRFAPGAEPRVLELRAVPGCGVEATIEEPDGTRHTIHVGRPEWITPGEPQGLSPRSFATHPLTAGHRIDVAIDGRLAAAAVVAERLRDSAPEALAEFRRLGLPVEVLTGDTAERAAALGLPPTRAGLLPDDKHRRVAELAAAGGKPLFVGDGINDAAALAAAHAGVALASGTDLAVGASAVTLYHGDLRVLPWAVALSREAVRAVRRNLYRALAYNVVGVALAAGGVLHPVVAALLMVVSSLTLIFSSTRVGVVAGRCADPASGGREPPEDARALRERVSRFVGLIPPARREALHFAAVALQGVAVLLLLEPARLFPVPVLGGFALAGGGLAWLWHRWAAIPHALDMAVGMLTLGNLGMLLGWWADLGFAPVICAQCCSCADPLAKPWMWLGMLAGANAAMLLLARRPAPRGRDHVAAMYTGGNLGMLAGMWVGGVAAAGLAPADPAGGFVLHFAGMTAGMLAGMFAGTWAAERLLAAVRAARVVPGWLARARTPG